MGSKQALLNGALGRALLRHTEPGRPFVDLFAGSGVVGTFVAEKTDSVVTTVDCQSFSSALALSVIDRESAVDQGEIVADWLKRSREIFDERRSDLGFTDLDWTQPENVARSRMLCRDADAGFIVRDYGGHYFSPLQALALECLLPVKSVGVDDLYWLKMGVIIRTASRVSASPGHTAQPFQPTERLLPYIGAAWRRDVFVAAESILNALAPRFARRRGSAVVEDANDYAVRVPMDATVFCDPPYSDVQYSRFYHVLEGIARGGWPEVHGAGRAPDLPLRTSSRYSLRTASEKALDELLDGLRSRRATVLLTFPSGDASNGVSGDIARNLAKKYFKVRSQLLPHTHSTLGGPATAKTGSRMARRPLNELLLVMKPS
ncbi:DNA adenine methylase [Nocardioides sp. SYSU D00038]|uniref:DNA adenine methylase n=1 Tax=Nocardioides sp. SYSU D00038 TaxID=2812554 RepID=UPI00196825D4|nr:DNA adenine methylase [Nocardioides sp. SYSU D00038]